MMKYLGQKTDLEFSAEALVLHILVVELAAAMMHEFDTNCAIVKPANEL